MILLNYKPINVTMFPDGTSQCWKLEQWADLRPGSPVDIDWEFTHEGEFMQLAQLKMLLDQHLCPTRLNISYLPYGRQDKPVGNEATFALVPFAKLLNSLNFDKVFIMDPHSRVATDLIERSVAEYPKTALYQTIDSLNVDAICYPDHGAYQKYDSMYRLGDSREVLYGKKVRDQSTGEIKGLEVFGAPWRGMKILIVDDLCDAGGTFTRLARLLLDGGALEVHLFVTHGLFTKGTRILRDAGISRIFTPKGEIHDRERTLQL